MPTARKLPSGSWRVRIFSHTDASGKKVYRSFTCNDTSPQGKWTCEQMASDWVRTKGKCTTDLKVSEAVKRYIESKRNVLSPSTIRGYTSIVPRFDGIGSERLDKLSTDILQRWISDLSADLSAKSVKNTWGLLSATLEHFDIQKTFKVRLPSANIKQYDLPSDEDIQLLLNHIEGTTLWIAVMLARYYSLRRSEICALDRKDLDGDILTVWKAIVHDEDGWVLKQRPKTDSSYRQLKIGDPLLGVMKKHKGKYFDCNPDALDNRLYRAEKTIKVKQFGLHSLRHMFATKAAIDGVPDILTARMGGWAADSKIMKRIYQNVRDGDLVAQMDAMNAAMKKDMDKSKKSKPKRKTTKGK